MAIATDSCLLGVRRNFSFHLATERNLHGGGLFSVYGKDTPKRTLVEKKWRTHHGVHICPHLADLEIGALAWKPGNTSLTSDDQKTVFCQESVFQIVRS